jgi:integrase
MRNPRTSKLNPTVALPDLWAPPRHSDSLTVGSAFLSYKTTLEARDHSAIQRASLWVETLGAKTPLSRVTNVQVNRVLDALTVQGPTKNRYASALSAIYRHAVTKMEWEGQNPTLGCAKFRENSCSQTGLEQDEIDRLLAACLLSSWPKLRLLVLMGIVTGLRRGNLTNLRYGDVDDQGRVKAGLTKNGTPFVAVMNKELAAEFKRFAEGADPDTLIFEGVQGRPFVFDKQYRTACLRAGLAHINFHTLRHTCASILARKGASTIEVMEFLNHKTPAMAGRYSHLNTKHRESRVEEIFGGVA